MEGLSPRVRGSRRVHRIAHAKAGSIPAGAGSQSQGFQIRSQIRSIPAGAGEPRCARIATCGDGVYPRGCGGASSLYRRGRVIEGLSPRVRGSLHWHCPPLRLFRSIPAGAGEPHVSVGIGEQQAVYPRGCGGANVSIVCAVNSGGLSPRVRGSRASRLDAGTATRSIPAGAGEPIPALQSRPS